MLKNTDMGGQLLKYNIAVIHHTPVAKGYKHILPFLYYNLACQDKKVSNRIHDFIVSVNLLVVDFTLATSSEVKGFLKGYGLNFVFNEWVGGYRWLKNQDL